MTATNYHQGEYAGPNTVRAMDYNGHEAIGVQISDVAEDGACFLVTIDKYMQLAIAPVIAASIRSYDPPEPPSMPELTPEDYASTENSLIDLWNRISHEEIDTPLKLANIAIVARELSNVWRARLMRFAQNTHKLQHETGARAAQAAGQRPALGLSAARAAQPTERQTQSREATI